MQSTHPFASPRYLLSLAPPTSTQMQLSVPTLEADYDSELEIDLPVNYGGYDFAWDSDDELNQDEESTDLIVPEIGDRCLRLMPARDFCHRCEEYRDRSTDAEWTSPGTRRYHCECDMAFYCVSAIIHIMRPRLNIVIQSLSCKAADQPNHKPLCDVITQGISAMNQEEEETYDVLVKYVLAHHQTVSR